MLSIRKKPNKGQGFATDVPVMHKVVHFFKVQNIDMTYAKLRIFNHNSLRKTIFKQIYIKSNANF